MTAATIHGVPITPARAAACRELLAGVASAAAWVELRLLVVESERVYVGVSPESDGEGKRHPPFGELYTVDGPPLLALASCALGTACARCSTPIEQEHDLEAIRHALQTSGPLPALRGEDLDDGWCCPPCVARQRDQEAFRRRAAMWLRRGNQMGLFGVEPARAEGGGDNGSVDKRLVVWVPYPPRARRRKAPSEVGADGCPQNRSARGTPPGADQLQLGACPAGLRAGYADPRRRGPR